MGFDENFLGRNFCGYSWEESGGTASTREF